MQFRIFKVENAKDYILTALILLFAISLLVSRHRGGLTTIRKVSITTVSLMEVPLSNIRIYRQALKTNAYLQQQNILLQDELSRLRSVEQENKYLRNLLGFKEASQFDLEAISIVRKELNGINNTFTADVGTEQGMAIGMPIVTSDGLVGKIVLTSNNYSQIMPYFNSLFRISARIQENQAVGIVSWTGDNHSELVMDFVPKTIRVDSGFVIESSGFSNHYPPGIPIGKVIRTEPETGKETQRIYLKPFVSLFDISEGFVMKFRPDSAIENLDRKFREQFE